MAKLRLGRARWGNRLRELRAADGVFRQGITKSHAAIVNRRHLPGSIRHAGDANLRLCVAGEPHQVRRFGQTSRRSRIIRPRALPAGRTALVDDDLAFEIGDYPMRPILEDPVLEGPVLEGLAKVDPDDGACGPNGGAALGESTTSAKHPNLVGTLLPGHGRGGDDR